MVFSNTFAPRSLVASALLATAFVAAPLVGTTPAQERLAPAGGSATLTDGSKPAVVATLGSLNKLMQDTNYITGVIGQPQFGGMFAMMAGGFAQGMDMDRPIAVFVSLAQGMPQPIIVLPTSDIKPILKRMEAQTGPIDELDDGTLMIAVNQMPVYIKQQGNIAVAAQSPEAIGLVPADPSGLYQGMGNNYDLAVRLQVQQVPIGLRNMLIDQMRQGFEQAMSQQPDAAGAREMAEGSIEQIERLVQEADELNIGLNINQSGRSFDISFSFSAVGGSQLASIYGGQQAIPSRFASVIRDDAAAYFHTATSIGPEAIEQGKEGVGAAMGMIKGAIASEGNLPADQAQKIELYIQRLSDILVDSISQGKSDVGGVLLAERGSIQFAMGMFVGNGADVAALIKDIAGEIPDQPGAPKFKANIGNVQGVDMHVLEADVPESEDEARKVFGEKLQVFIGTAPNAVYVALGKQSGDLVKQLIGAGSDSGSGDRPLGQFKFRLLPILEFAQSIEENQALGMVINTLASSDDKGELSIVSESIPNGSKTEFSIAEGLIKAIGVGVMMGQQQQQAF